MKNKRLFFSLFLSLIFLFSAGMYYFAQFPDWFKITQIIYLVSPFIAVLSGFYLVKTYGIGGSRGKVFLFFTLGLLAWFLGDVLWMLFSVFLDIDPFPSVADVVYLISYPLLLTSVLIEVFTNKISWTAKKLVPAILLSAFLIIFTSYYGIYYAYSTDATMLENIVSIAYGVGDTLIAVLIIFVLMVSLEYQKGQFFLPWIGLFMGMIFMVFADILYAVYYEPYGLLIKTYQYIDLLWIASYLTFSYSQLCIASIVKGAQDKIKPKK